MVKELPVIDKRDKFLICERSPISFYANEAFMAGSGSEILSDTKWYTDGISNSLNPTPAITPVNNIIEIEKSFQKQFDKLFTGEARNEYYNVKVKMQSSLAMMMYLMPYKISLQLTNESFYYTLIFQNTTIYFEHFYVDIADEMDEAIVSIYENKKNALNYGGNLEITFNKILQYFQQNTKATLGVYGIPNGNFTQY